MRWGAYAASVLPAFRFESVLLELFGGIIGALISPGS